MTSSAEIRRTFLDFFRQRGHEIVASSSLVPGNDPTLLFTNAGMVQFKDVFLGRDRRPYQRATTSQRCVRAGGKHNDLENVGYTARHHTFFEMLGNFSFGDYFKREAIHYAWELLTKVWGLPPERLWVTVFEEDEEAARIWLDEIKADPQRFSRIGAKDNFWAMGDTGPCGPCSEIFYDHGPEVPGGPPGSPEEDGDRYIEIWNLVFMQYDRSSSGELTPLPKPSVDTGMGLERLAAVLQGVHSNYEIDLFQRLITAAAEATQCSDRAHNSLKVIADHIRSTAFLINDGVLPGNAGRDYVLRRIMRRAIRHGYKLGASDPFFYRLVEPLAAEMGEAYPELRQQQARIEATIRQEEERFAETLERGMNLLESAIAKLSARVIPGETAFDLYATYGFPVDLTADIARERGLTIDMAGFEAAQEAHRLAGSKGGGFSAEQGLKIEVQSQFLGYETLASDASVAALFHGGEVVERLNPGEEGIVILDRTPFYGESGGQVGDAGALSWEGGRFVVATTRKQGSALLHYGQLEAGELHRGQRLQASVDAPRRQAIRLNHSATHLLHAALRRVLGSHVAQRGSLVEPDRLRFDFSHGEPINAEQLEAIEELVNAHVRHNTPVTTRVMPLKEAMALGAMALFGEKYGDEVRVVDMGEFSIELCGGTHVHQLGEIGLLKIVNEGSVASGIRRMEAVTGQRALEHVAELQRSLGRIAALVKGDRHHPEAKVETLVERNRQLEKELEQLKSRLASGQGSDLASQAVDIAGVTVIAAELPGADAKTLREAVDRLKDRFAKAAIVLAAVEEGKVRLVAGVTKSVMGTLPAGELVNVVAQRVGGKGGGRPDLAQAGGSDPSALAAALDEVPAWIRNRF